MTETSKTQRQFCRKSLHSCVPAVTLTFDDGTRRLHWCADHAEDAENYRADSDYADVEVARAAAEIVQRGRAKLRRALAKVGR